MHELNATYRVQAAFKDTTGDLVKRVYSYRHNDTATESQQRYRNGYASYARGELGCPPPKVVTVLIGSNDLHTVVLRPLQVGEIMHWNYPDRYARFEPYGHTGSAEPIESMRCDGEAMGGHGLLTAPSIWR
jgi:hypothetical protein